MHPGGMTWVLAHEIGHAVQDRDGLYRAEDKAYESEKDPALAAGISRRFEAHADVIGQGWINRAGYVETAADLIVAVQKCEGSPQRRWKFGADKQPSWAYQWVMGVRAREDRCRKDTTTLRHSTSAAYAAPPQVAMDALDPDGGRRRSGEVRSEDRDIPTQFRLTPSGGRVPLPDGRVWLVPAPLNHFTPAEIFAFAIKGDAVPDSIASAFRDGFAELERSGEWGRLPGKFVSPQAGH